jgi:4-hydroxybenzoate polyprenyltransferase/phosphoserine phosphatase
MDDFEMTGKRPLVVDLDGTLTRTDTLFESFVKCAKVAPLGTARSLVDSVVSGKAAMKERLASIAVPDESLLPYRSEVLEMIRKHRDEGGRVVLATGAHRSIAQRVATRLGCFDEVLATEGDVNLVGKAKADLLVSRFGKDGFDYVGDSKADIPVWNAARERWGVGARARSISRRPGLDLRRVDSVSPPGSAWKILRPHQWAKNILVALPILSSHKFMDVFLLGRTALVFLAFSVLASSVYVGNDMFDCESDRKNPAKSRRPIASGRLSIPRAVLLMCGLLALTVALAAFLPWQAEVALGIYLAANLLYTVHFKRRLLVDVFLLAFMYVWRIVAGSLATGIELSGWLLGFSVFLFLSLAFAKRYAEVVRLDGKSGKAAGRAWAPDDANFLATGVAGAIVLALYVTGKSFSELYVSPQLVTMLSPLFLYWILRIWIQTCRREMHEDPVLFAAKDKVSYLVVACAALVLVLASFKF